MQSYFSGFVIGLAIILLSYYSFAELRLFSATDWSLIVLITAPAVITAFALLSLKKYKLLLGLIAGSIIPPLVFFISFLVVISRVSI
jgi:hypothetical protein